MEPADTAEADAPSTTPVGEPVPVDKPATVESVTVIPAPHDTAEATGPVPARRARVARSRRAVREVTEVAVAPPAEDAPPAEEVSRDVVSPDVAAKPKRTRARRAISGLMTPAAAVPDPAAATALGPAMPDVGATGSVGVPAGSTAAMVSAPDTPGPAEPESAQPGTDEPGVAEPVARESTAESSSAEPEVGSSRSAVTKARRATAPTWAGIHNELVVEPAIRPVLRRPVAMVTFQAPEPAVVEARWRRAAELGSAATAVDSVAGTAFPSAERQHAEAPAHPRDEADVVTDPDTTDLDTMGDLAGGEEDSEFDDDPDGGGSASTRRRRRGRRGRGRARGDEDGVESGPEDGVAAADDTGREGVAQDADGADGSSAAGQGTGSVPAGASDEGAETPPGAAEENAERDGEDEDDRLGGARRRRRRRRRGGGDEPALADDPPNTVVHVRETRKDEDLVRGLSGSTRLEAKRQRRREGRDSGRRRPPIVTEAEFLARRESVERRMVVRHAGDRTQIAVLEDGVLVEHFVTRASSASYAGNIYLGRVQNVLASMEAAFVDIGKGRNAVLYAGEVNYDASGLDGRPRKIEQVLKSGQSVLVQVSKDPIGHKGARLTSQISLPGRYLVFVPDGQNAGISRKLPDTERARLKSILKKITPEDGGVIVRTAAEGASEAELERDIERLAAQWEDIERKAKKASAPSLLYGEPDLVVRVIRDIFNEDFTELVVQGSGEATTIEEYIDTVAPDLRPRIRRYTGTGDVFAEYRVDEQLAKALDRKVWLPSGGSLVIDRTEAMTVIDVNTGKFTGKGGNLEETVTKNNLEAAEEIVRQLRLRDIGGIIVIDFIDMVLESNRELVLRRLTECLGRDRTRHQVAEVTSLGLVQMTRKRVGQGLLEAYSEPCVHCNGRGVVIHLDGGSGAHAAVGVPSGTIVSGAGQPTPVAVPAPAPAEGPGSGRRARSSSTRAVSTRAVDDPTIIAAAASAGPTSVSESEASAGSGEPGGSSEPGGSVASSTPGAAENVAVTAGEGAMAGEGVTAADTVPAHAADSAAGPADVAAAAAAPGPVAAGSPAGSNGQVPVGGGSGAGGFEDALPPVYANSDDPDSLATADNALPTAGKPARSRRRRASRPVSKPAESLESVRSAEPPS
ncbi:MULTISPECIES: Rne/Rng family ribonuclease [unclassified Frankia]